MQLAKHSCTHRLQGALTRQTTRCARCQFLRRHAVLRQNECCARCGLARAVAPADVPVAEQELAAEVGLLDDVVVRHHQPPRRAGRDAHHGQVLEELAPQRARAHQEHAQRLQPPLQPRPEHRDLPVVAAPLRAARQYVFNPLPLFGTTCLHPTTLFLQKASCTIRTHEMKVVISTTAV